MAEAAVEPQVILDVEVSQEVHAALTGDFWDRVDPDYVAVTHSLAVGPHPAMGRWRAIAGRAVYRGQQRIFLVDLQRVDL